MHKTEDEWIRAYQDKGALWIHDGAVHKPHALLTSGNHSNGFFNSRLVVADEELLFQAAEDLFEKLMEVDTRAPFTPSEIDRVVGPQTGATKLAELTAKVVSRRTLSGHCEWASPAKHEEGGLKSMVWDNPARKVLSGEVVILCEDVITTGGSVELTEKAVRKNGGKLYAFVLALVNRSGEKMAGGRIIVPLIERHMPIWAPEECPLCKGGSEAVRPKDNWARLTA